MTRGYSTCTTPTSNGKRSSKSTRNFRNKRRGDRARPEFWNERNLATKTGLYDMPFVKGKGEKR